MNVNAFDAIAPIYDFLARWVYGNRIQIAQQDRIQTIQGAQSILWIGGGTGLALPTLLKNNPLVHIHYIEASQSMIHLAQKKLAMNATLTIQDRQRVIWHHATHEYLYQVENQTKLPCFDHILTFFFLDVLDEQACQLLINTMTQYYTHPQSQWHWIDFYNEGRYWQRTLLYVMYKFFAYVSRLHNQTLSDFSCLFAQKQWILQDRQSYLSGFIRSESYILD